jgi:hypothetical protein
MWPGWWQEVLQLSAVYKARHDNQLNDTQPNDAQHTDVRQNNLKNSFYDTQLGDFVIRALNVWCRNAECQCAKRCYAEYQCAERCYAECHGAL